MGVFRYVLVILPRKLGIFTVDTLVLFYLNGMPVLNSTKYSSDLFPKNPNIIQVTDFFFSVVSFLQL